MSRDSGAKTARSGSMRYEAILDTVGDGVYELDPSGHFVDVNEVVTDVTGYSRERLLGEHASILLSDPDLERCASAIHDVLQGNRGVATVEVDIQIAVGPSIPAEIRLSPLVEDGEFYGSVGVVRDLTDQHEREGQYRRERTLNERVLEAMPVGVGVTNRAGDIVRSNAQANSLLGTDQFEGQYRLGARDVYDESGAFVPVDERPYVRVFETGEPVEDWTCQLTVPDQPRRWLSINVEPIYDDAGEVDLAVITAEDITSLRERNEQLESKLDEVFSRIDDAFFAIDDEWHVTYVNDRARNLLAEDGREITGRVFQEVFPDSRGSSFEQSCREAMAAQEAVSFEERFPPLDAWYEVRAYPSATGLSVYFHDVTERKRRERTLQRLNEATQDFPHMSSREAVADRLVTVASDVLGPSDVAVYLHDCREGMLVPAARSESVAADGELQTVSTTASGPVGSAFRSGETVIRETVEEEPGVRGSMNRGVAVPLGKHGVLLAGDGNAGSFDAQTANLAELLVANAESALDRIEREGELRSRIRQQEVIASLGRRALAARGLDDLFEATAEVVADTLDNEYCKVLDLQPNEDRLLLRAGVGWREGLVGEATVGTEHDSQAGYTLKSEEPVVVESLAEEDRFSGPELLTSHDVVSGISTIIGPLDDPWGVLGTHDTDRSAYSKHDVNFVQAVANILATAIERLEYEERLEHRREQLAALDRINHVVRDVNHAVVEQSTREELAQRVCDRLSESESYAFAWAGKVDSRTGRVSLVSEAGVENYLGSSASVDATDDALPEPVRRAIETQEVQAAPDILNDPACDSGREDAREFEYRSMVAIPVIYKNTIYGVLCVYTSRERAFGDEELAVVGQLGEVIGYAVTAMERKHALISDAIIEVEFSVPDMFESVPGVEFATGEIVFERMIHVGGETFLVYGTTTADAVDDLRAFAAEQDAVDRMKVFDESEDGTQFELRLSNPVIGMEIAEHGGRLQSVTFEDGDLHLIAELPPGEDVRSIANVLQKRYSRAELISQRRTTRQEQSTAQVRSSVTEHLTKRQQAALEAAYYSGYFEWPRETDGTDLADSMGISSPTLHQHLRTGQRKVLDVVFASDKTQPGNS